MSRVKGWCPSAHRPMMSGDGLLVRVKPPLGQLSADAVKTLCDLATRYGSGLIDLTARANLQIRGVAEADHPALLSELIAAGLVDPDVHREITRNVIATPYWREGDRTTRLYDAVVDVLAQFALPDKFGIALDTGQAPVLQGASGDFRFETTDKGALLLRADGAAKGRVIAEAYVADALAEALQWFVYTGGMAARRVSRHIQNTALPEAWQQALPAEPAPNRVDEADQRRATYGVAFGQTTASGLRALIEDTDATHLRTTPWRILLLENARQVQSPDFLVPDHPLLKVSACPGAPHCAQASVNTRDLARDLSEAVDGTLHVSGCAKGCASPSASALTLVGRDGRFDLVRAGRAGDTPERRGLTADEARRLEK